MKTIPEWVVVTPYRLLSQKPHTSQMYLPLAHLYPASISWSLSTCEHQRILSPYCSIQETQDYIHWSPLPSPRSWPGLWGAGGK